MKRRSLLKALSVVGSGAIASSMVGTSIFRPAWAAADASRREFLNSIAIVKGEIEWAQPAVMPTVINLFLYGGPSELAGNLTNIAEISAASQNPYSTLVNAQGQIINQSRTDNGFWRDAGGTIMERMIPRGDLTVLRTLWRDRDDSKAHRPSIFSNMTGQIGEDDARPGMGTVVAAILFANGATINGKPFEEWLFPLVTFEGDSLIFNKGNVGFPTGMRPMALDSSLNNPYSRSNNSRLGTGTAFNENNAKLDELARSTNAANSTRFEKLLKAFSEREKMEGFVKQLQGAASAILPLDPDFVATAQDPTAQPIDYGNNSFGRNMKAAVTLAIDNPESVFIAVGTGGLGGWDDHDNAIEKYEDRMTQLMTALEAAGKHMRATSKNNIVINVYGDFGRNVNLNGSMGWDHGNNQNLYTVGGAGIVQRATLMGKLLGTTEKVGPPNQNRQFTQPTDDSYRAHPIAVASSVYAYFGVQNPETLTNEPIISANQATNLFT